MQPSKLKEYLPETPALSGKYCRLFATDTAATSWPSFPQSQKSSILLQSTVVCHPRLYHSPVRGQNLEKMLL
ncbi:hypothetical protein TIFTF001_053909 [Ficus carica]|uniref:Uncharacterized protein n=1 Tax=Ficus carica TaxID=3494 RepID=A0AA88EHC9_FICCA|nr:hypothetical protein TIFTF001_053909 [Ficus carica]